MLKPVEGTAPRPHPWSWKTRSCWALAFSLAFALVWFGLPGIGTPVISNAAPATSKMAKGRYASVPRWRGRPSKSRATTAQRPGWVAAVDWTGADPTSPVPSANTASGTSSIPNSSPFAAAMATPRGAFLTGPLASHLGIDIPATAVTIASAGPAAGPAASSVVRLPAAGHEFSAVATPPQPPPSSRAKVPVLMYHEIGDGPSELYVRTDDFSAQMDLLAKKGFATISVDQLYAALVRDGPLPERPIVLTFDDGYESVYKTVFPILKKYGFSGVFFVPTHAVGSHNRVTWDELREMQNGGMDIESHSDTHVDLEVISGDWTRLARETSGARLALQSQLGTKVEYFCYPSGRYNEKVLEAIQAAGYKGAFTTKGGWTTSSQSPLEWRRVRINRSDGLAGFASKLGIEP